MRKKVLTFFATAAALLWPVFALASQFDVNTVGNKIEGLPAAFKDLGNAIPKIYTVAIVIAAVIFVITFLIGGIRYLSNAGNDEGTSKAKKLMIDAIIGLVLTLAAWALANFVYVQLTGRTVGGTSLEDPPNNSPLPSAISPQPSDGVATTNPNEGRFCASGSTNCATVALNFTNFSGGGPAANYRFQVQITPPATAGVLDFLIPHAQAATQSSQILTTDATGRASLTAKVGSNLIIKQVDNTPLVTKVISQILENVTLQVTSVVKRQVNFKFLQSNSLQEIGGYQFLLKDKTGKILAGPLTTSVAGYQQADLPKGEVVNVTTTNGAIIYSDIVPDDNGRIWTVFLNEGGRVGFRIQAVAFNEILPGFTMKVSIGSNAPVAYTTDANGYIGPITADVGATITAVSDSSLVTLGNCTFVVPPRNASVYPCTATFDLNNYTPPTGTPTGPPATPR